MKKKILIVDYDTNSLDSLTDIFLPYQLQILRATDGQMAYDKYRSEKPDLILLEAMLPKLHGFDLAQRIYHETQGSVPIVIVTGLYKGPQFKNEAKRSFGVAAYFEKPFDRDKLAKTVMNLLLEEIDIEEELPDPDSVVNYLNQMAKKRPSPSDKKINS